MDKNNDNSLEDKNNTKNNQNISALQHNIKTKGENAYYYAHGRKVEPNSTEAKTIEGPGIITGGNPTLLEKKVVEIENKVIKKFEKYAFYDDNDFVQIRVDLKNYFQDINNITDDCIESTLEEKSMSIRLNVPDGDPHMLVVKKFNKSIVPNESKVRILKGKLAISLKKNSGSETWDKLNA